MQDIFTIVAENPIIIEIVMKLPMDDDKKLLEILELINKQNNQAT